MPSRKRNRLAVFYDLSKAFDKVWREGLLLKVLQAGVSGRMYKWIRCFLHDRSARVKVDGHLSDSVKMRECVPQGGVVSTTLFLVYINNNPTLSQDMSPTPSMQSTTLYNDYSHVYHSVQ